MKAYRFFIIVLVVILALPAAGRLIWLMKKSKPLDVIIINKSVEKISRNEIKALNWVLNSEKFVDSAGDFYDYRADYLGYFPDAVTEDRKIKSYKLDEAVSMAQTFDALVFIDNKGVELSREYKLSTKRMQYGGLNQNDYLLIREMSSRQKLIIGEFNFFSSPTEDLVRYNAEQFLDIYSLGWTGKYFKNLAIDHVSKEIPSDWLEIYKLNYSEDWNFSGAGLILANKAANRIIVLPADKFMNAKFPDIVTPEEISNEWGLPPRASYDGWFDIAYPGKNKVISYINLNLNEDGIDLLRTNGIDPEFPAVIESTGRKFYYLAGDFSKSGGMVFTSRYSFLSDLYKNFGKGQQDKPGRFFKVYYIPLLTGIFNDYYSEISVNQE